MLQIFIKLIKLHVDFSDNFFFQINIVSKDMQQNTYVMVLFLRHPICLKCGEILFCV